MYDESITDGSIIDNCVEAEADNANMKMVASGVRVTEACVAAIRLIIATGLTHCGTALPSNIKTE